MSAKPATPILPDVEPWPEPINDGAALLDEIAATLRRFLTLPEKADTAVALWVVFAHALDAFHVSPRLFARSATKRSGKTTLLHLLKALTPRSLHTSNTSAALVYRLVDKERPTLLIDEADTFLREDSKQVGVLNAGHTRSTRMWVNERKGDDWSPKGFNNWAAIAFAGISKLAGTLEDRSIIIPMKRQLPHEKAERLRLDRLEQGQFSELQRRIARWAADNLEALRALDDPPVPDVLHDRAADNWRPLLAIADLAGGQWPQSAREAAIVLTECGEASEEMGVTLLRDLHGTFATLPDPFSGQEAVGALRKLDDAPWVAHDLNPYRFSALLQEFSIKPEQIKRAGKKIRGYRHEWFADAFARYLPGTPGTPVPLRLMSSNGNGFHGTGLKD